MQRNWHQHRSLLPVVVSQLVEARTHSKWWKTITSVILLKNQIIILSYFLAVIEPPGNNKKLLTTPVSYKNVRNVKYHNVHRTERNPTSWYICSFVRDACSYRILCKAMLYNTRSRVHCTATASCVKKIADVRYKSNRSIIRYMNALHLVTNWQSERDIKYKPKFNG
jgi:hypothetical protein